MLIAIDASRANKQHKTGVEWYSYHVIEELKKLTTGEHEVLLYTNTKLTAGLEKMPLNWREKILTWPPKYLWTQLRLWWDLVKNPPNVLFIPAHTLPFLPISRRTKVIVTVHDVGFKRFPKLYKKIQYWYHDLTMRSIRNRADVILTVSEFSKKEIVQLYGVEPGRIVVAYLGYDSGQYSNDLQEKPSILQQYKIKQPYLLFVGRIEKKKNVLNIVKAFQALSQKRPELNLALVGGQGNQSKSVMNFIKKQQLTNKVILPGYVAEKNLPYLFKSAEVFLFPTLYEGFGIPLLQAMAVGTPVVTANQDPHREVAKDGAVYANPQYPLEIASEIENVLTDAILRKKLVQAGLIRVKNFTWRGLAKKLETLMK